MRRAGEPVLEGVSGMRQSVRVAPVVDRMHETWRGDVSWRGFDSSMRGVEGGVTHR